MSNPAPRGASLVLAVFACAALAGCPSKPTVGLPPPAPAQVAAWYGQPVALAAVLLLRATDVAKDSTTITLYVWRDRDGRTRLKLTKVDIEVLAALVQPDGSFAAFAPRSGLRTTGDLGDPALPPGLADLRLLLDEVAAGPLPPELVPALRASTDAALAPLPGGATLVAIGRADAPDVALGFSRQRDEVAAKTIGPAAAPLYRVTYGPAKDFDGVHRAGKVEVAAAGGASVVAYLRTFESLGAISAERMRLTIPDTATAVTPAQLLERLDQ